MAGVIDSLRLTRLVPVVLERHDDIRQDALEVGLNPKFLSSELLKHQEEVERACLEEIGKLGDLRRRLERGESQLKEMREEEPEKPAGTLLSTWLGAAVTVVSSAAVVWVLLRWTIAQWFPSLAWAPVIAGGIAGLANGVRGYFDVLRSRERWRLWLAWNENLRALEKTLDIAGLDQTVRNADEALDELLAEKAVPFTLRLIIDKEKAASYSTTWGGREAPGLAEVFAPDYDINTDASKELRRVLDGMSGGSIGIAGPRGVGKTTLIRSICRDVEQRDSEERDAIGVPTSAPVTYNARDFVLHLFAFLCEEALKAEGVDPSLTENAEPEEEGRSRRAETADRLLKRFAWFTLRAGLLLVLLALPRAGLSAWPVDGSLGKRAAAGEEAIAHADPQVGAGATERTATKPAPASHPTSLPAGEPEEPSVTWAAVLVRAVDALFPKASELLAAGILLLVGCYFARAATVRTNDADGSSPEDGSEESPPQDDRDLIIEEARRNLTNIRFQRSYTTGWSGSFRLSVGLSTDVQESVSRSRQPLSLPEIVRRYREFAQLVTQNRKVIIGIDELDKIQSDDAAQRFLNEIKMIFGMDRCFYLVSVSNSAMNSFERRGLPFRNAFDSSFDDVIHVDYIDLKHSRTLLAQRIIGLPVPFVCLCHCLSGGLARDLIRACRALNEKARGVSGEATLSSLAQQLIDSELDSKVDAVFATAGDLANDSGAPSFLIELDALRSQHSSAEAMRNSCNRLVDHPEHVGSVGTGPIDASQGKELLRRLGIEFATYLYFCATVLDYFGKERSEQEWEEAIAKSPVTEGSVDQLARVRQLLAVNTGLAWARINAIRRKEGLDLW